MNRRRFLRNTTGLFVPALFGIITAEELGREEAEAQVFNFGSQANLKSSGGASCNTLADSNTTLTSNLTIWQFSSTQYYATQFTAGSTYTCCQVGIYFATVLTAATGTWDVSILNDSTNTPGTLLGTGSGSFNRSAIVAAQENKISGTLSASIVSGTKYWVMIHSSLADGSPGTNFAWEVTAFSGGLIFSSATGTSGWSNQANDPGWFKTYHS